MAAAFQAVNTPVATVTTTLSLVAPVILGGDVMFAMIHTNDNVAPTTTDTNWTVIANADNTANQHAYLAWRRCSDADSEATFAWTVAGTTVAFGALVTYRNVIRAGQTGLPYTTASTQATAVAEDNVNYATLMPYGPSALIVAFGFYNDDLTTAGAFSGTLPTMTNRLDAESPTGNDASLFIHDGPSLNGAATGARTLATASTADAISYGIMIDVMADEFPGASTSYSPKHPALFRSRAR